MSANPLRQSSQALHLSQAIVKRYACISVFAVSACLFVVGFF